MAVLGCVRDKKEHVNAVDDLGRYVVDGVGLDR